MIQKTMTLLNGLVGLGFFAIALGVGLLAVSLDFDATARFGRPDDWFSFLGRLRLTVQDRDSKETDHITSCHEPRAPGNDAVISTNRESVSQPVTRIALGGPKESKRPLRTTAPLPSASLASKPVKAPSASMGAVVIRPSSNSRPSSAAHSDRVGAVTYPVHRPPAATAIAPLADARVLVQATEILYYREFSSRTDGGGRRHDESPVAQSLPFAAETGLVLAGGFVDEGPDVTTVRPPAYIWLVE